MIKNFDLTGYECFSERRNSKNYVSSDKKWMVKFLTEATEKSVEELIKEKEYTDKALEVGIKTPKVKDVVELADGTKGIIYEYIEGKKSIARAIADDYANMDSYMKRFARMAKEFHSIKGISGKFDNFEERAKEQIKLSPHIPEKYKETLNKFIDTVEHKDTVLLGDFQTGNFIITDKDEFIIDLGNLACGNPLCDVGVFCFFMLLMPPFISEKVFRLESKCFKPMWDTFVKYYFSLNTEKEIDEKTKEIKKYALAFFPALFFTAGSGPEMIDIYEKNVDEVFNK